MWPMGLLLDLFTLKLYLLLTTCHLWSMPHVGHLCFLLKKKKDMKCFLSIYMYLLIIINIFITFDSDLMMMKRSA
jgi:hypothetical protein